MELAGVEMPPLPLRGMVVACQLTATLRAVPATAFWMLDVDVDLGRLDVEPHVRDLPRGGQAKNLLVELRVEHAPCLRGRAAFSPTELPTKIPDGPEKGGHQGVQGVYGNKTPCRFRQHGANAHRAVSGVLGLVTFSNEPILGPAACRSGKSCRLARMLREPSVGTVANPAPPDSRRVEHAAPRGRLKGRADGKWARGDSRCGGFSS